MQAILLRGSVVAYFIVLLLLIPSNGVAVSCAEFNSMGEEKDSWSEVVNSNPNALQIEEFKGVIAPYAGNLSRSRNASDRAKALELVVNRGLLVRYIADSLFLTRTKCLSNPNTIMRDVAIEQFNFMLDAILVED